MSSFPAIVPRDLQLGSGDNREKGGLREVPILLRAVWIAKYPDAIVELVAVFRRKIVCDISHFRIFFPMEFLISSQLKPNKNRCQWRI